jgi:uncharacterized protein YxjI
MTFENKLNPAFQHNYYLFRRKVFKIFGGAFHIYDEQGILQFYSKQKAFRIREDFRVFSNESQNQELLSITTPEIFDFWATYNVLDSTTGSPVGAIRRKAIKSIIKDEWTFLSNDGREIGKLTEKSIARALLSRFIKLIPQAYIIYSYDGRVVCEINRHFNPFVLKYSMRILTHEPLIDRRLMIAAGILLAGIERRQD